MKKLVVLLLAIAILIASKTTYAATTFSFEETVGSNAINYHSGDYYSKVNSDLYTIKFAYLKKIKLNIDYLSGEYKINEKFLDAKWKTVQIGYPVLNYPKELIYITLGGFKYSESAKISDIEIHEADGGIIGVDFVGVLSNKFQIELKSLKSLSVSSRFSYTDVWTSDINTIISAADLTVNTIELRYLLSDNLGIFICFQSMNFDIKDSFCTDVELKYRSIGFIYRF